MKRQLLIAGIITMVILSLCSCKSRADAGKENGQAKQERVALTKDQLEPGTFYARSGEFFLKLPSGSPHFDITEDFKKASADRVVSFLTTVDDDLIPTIYSDDTLAYYVDTSMPEMFTLERYEDEGYTIGLYGLKKTSYGVSMLLSDATYVSSSDFEAKASEALTVTADTEFTISQIGEVELGESDLSPCGSILGMTAGNVYKCDLYAGTQYAALEIAADSHIFSSMEAFNISDFSMDKDGYASINIPKDFLSGYYYCNQIGMFRYVNHTRAQGDADIDFNIPYYYEEPDGTVITYNEWIEKYGAEEEYKPQTFTQSFNANHLSMNIRLSYPATITLESTEEQPMAIVTSPSGDEYQMDRNDTDTERRFTFDSKSTEAGDWTISVYHMEGIPYSIVSAVEDPDTDTIVISGNSRGELSFYSSASKPYDQITVGWDNSERAADIKIKAPSGKEYSLNKTPENVGSESTYGKLIMAVQPEEGDWLIEIKGEDLGRVRYTLHDAPVEEPEESGEGEKSRE